jgi:putative aminopeptidase FrvX
MASLQRRGIAADVQGVFTRAEEVGFVGAGGVLRSLRGAVVVEIAGRSPAPLGRAVCASATA